MFMDQPAIFHCHENLYKEYKDEFENLHVKGVEEVRNPFDGPRDQLNIFPVKVRFQCFL